MKKARWIIKQARKLWHRSAVLRVTYYIFSSLLFFAVIALFYLIAAADYAQRGL